MERCPLPVTVLTLYFVIFLASSECVGSTYRTDKDTQDEVLSQFYQLQDRMLQQEKTMKKQTEKMAVLEQTVFMLKRTNEIQAEAIDELRSAARNSELRTMRNELSKNEGSDIDEGKSKDRQTMNNDYAHAEIDTKEKQFTNKAFNDTTSHILPPLKRIETRSDDVNPLLVNLNHVTKRVDNMAAQMTALESSVSNAASSVFVRWGSNNCGPHAQLVYHGWVGGSYYSQPGGAVNYLCLPPNPVFSSSYSGSHAGARLFGGEYQTKISNTDDKDPVCSVCKSGFPDTLMIPATNACPTGWTKQYAGYLMAGEYDHASGSEFICVDTALEVAVHSEGNENGKLLYLTASRCGSLPCPPYVNDKIVVCVVCSK